ncbi:MAG TPA: class I SAM-dependent methyltransferase [Patescibacteria group bacterium]|nr:class I SAM-dependent methyltransferase [Patescibacteria group bacterium]
MLLETFHHFPDFELLDSGAGYRLERWGQAILARPDPQAIWQKSLPETAWQTAWAVFRAAAGKERGHWQVSRPLPQPWLLNFHETKFLLKPSPFKHTGLFAEQAAQWEWLTSKLSSSSGNKANKSDAHLKNSPPDNLVTGKLKILNLFGYTGGATMVLAKAGCQVTHVDASKPALAWAGENARLNQLPKEAVRWILDDAGKFVKRELKRGSRYHGIIMDPPAFGHGPSGKTWKFSEDLPGLLGDCAALLADDARFLLVNGYATNSSALALGNLLEDAMHRHPGKIESGELCLRQKNQRLLSTGIFARWNS